MSKVSDKAVFVLVEILAIVLWTGIMFGYFKSEFFQVPVTKTFVLMWSLAGVSFLTQLVWVYLVTIKRLVF